MLKLKINNEYLKKDDNSKILEFDKIIRDKNSISCIKNNMEILKFNGIKNFSIFQVENGNWDIKINEKELQTNILAELTIENKKKDAMITNLAETVANLAIQVNQLKGSVQ